MADRIRPDREALAVMSGRGTATDRSGGRGAGGKQSDNQVPDNALHARAVTYSTASDGLRGRHPILPAQDVQQRHGDEDLPAGP